MTDPTQQPDPQQAPPPAGNAPLTTADKQVLVGPASVEPGKMLAMVSYGGIFFSLPLGVIPLFMRDNEFAMYHGKQATASFIIMFVLAILVSIITAITCGFGAILFPVLFLPLVTAIHGIILANKGEMKEPFGVFGLGNKLFSSVKPGA